MSVLEGRLELAAEHRVGRHIECQFDRVIGVSKAKARIWVQVWGRLRVRPEQALLEFADVCMVDFYV